MKFFNLTSILRWWLMAMAMVVVTACGGDGDDDSVAPTGSSSTPGETSTGTSGSSSPAISASQQQLVNTYAASLTGSAAIPANQSTARGSGSIVVDPNTRTLIATLVTNEGLGTSASIQSGSTTSTGVVVFNLEENTPGNGVWSTTQTLTQEQLNDFNGAVSSGTLFFVVNSIAFPQGELRGQILPQQQSGAAGPTSTSTSTTAGTNADASGNAGTSSGISGTSGTGTTGPGTADTSSTTRITSTGTTGTTSTTGTTGRTGMTGTGITGTSGATGTTSTGATGTIGTIGATTAASFSRTAFVAALRGSQVAPATSSTAIGAGTVSIDPSTRSVVAAVVTSGLTGTAAHVHAAAPGLTGPIVMTLTETSPGSGVWTARQTLEEGQIESLRQGIFHFDVHSQAFPGAEIRGQIVPIRVSPTDGAATGSSTPAAGTATPSGFIPGFGTGTATATLNPTGTAGTTTGTGITTGTTAGTTGTAGSTPVAPTTGGAPS